MKKSMLVLTSTISIALTACGGGGGGSPSTGATTTQEWRNNPAFTHTYKEVVVAATVHTDDQTAQLDTLVELDNGKFLLETPSGTHAIDLSGHAYYTKAGDDNIFTKTLYDNAYPSLMLKGYLTPEAQVPTKGVANYTGNAYLLNQTIKGSSYDYDFPAGQAKLQADFTNKALTGNLDFTANKGFTIPVDAEIKGNVFASKDGAKTDVIGAFTGSKADGIIGSFINEEHSAVGVFRANSTDVQALAPIPDKILVTVNHSGSSSSSGNSGSASWSSGSSGSSTYNPHPCTWVDGHWRTRNGTRYWVNGYWRGC